MSGKLFDLVEAARSIEAEQPGVDIHRHSLVRVVHPCRFDEKSATGVRSEATDVGVATADWLASQFR
jgi:hypothetical protein